MTTATEALARLMAGNRRFVGGKLRGGRPQMRARLAEAQNPFAIVLGCSDSRVPVEIVFDQDLGDLFVIRVAGNIAAPSQIGSVEYAAEQFGVRLVVVLGHSDCGAVTATLQQLEQPEGLRSPNLAGIVHWIRPAVERIPAREAGDFSQWLQQAVRANIVAAAERLRTGSEILASLIRDRRLLVVGAEYSLSTGEVVFFDGVPSNIGA